MPLSGPLSFDEATDFMTSTIKPYNGATIVYNPMPYEMIKTQHTNPQIVMTVDSLPAACRKVDCDFLYADAAPEMTSFSLAANAAGSLLTITGTDFTDRVYRIVHGGIGCTVETKSATSITCNLDEDIPAGSWKPVLTDYFGEVPSGSVSAVTVPLVIVSLTPNSDVNPNGGTLLTIEGSGFFNSLAQASDDFSIMFNGGVPCNIKSISSTQITCAPETFPTENTSYTLTMTINS